jgi:hypothetical protein
MGCNSFDELKDTNYSKELKDVNYSEYCLSLNRERCEVEAECKVLETGEFKSYGRGSNFYIYDNKNLCSDFNSSPIFIGCFEKDENIFQDSNLEKLYLYSNGEKYIATDSNLSSELLNWKFDEVTTKSLENHIANISFEKRYFPERLYPKHCGWEESSAIDCFDLNQDNCENYPRCEAFLTDNYFFHSINLENFCIEKEKESFVSCKYSGTSFLLHIRGGYSASSVGNVELLKNNYSNQYILNEQNSHGRIELYDVNFSNAYQYRSPLLNWHKDKNKTEEMRNFYRNIPDENKSYIFHVNILYFTLLEINGTGTEVMNKFYQAESFQEQKNLLDNMGFNFHHTQYLNYCDSNISNKLIFY